MFYFQHNSDPYASQWALVALRNICLLSNDARQYIQQLKVCFFATILKRNKFFFFLLFKAQNVSENTVDRLKEAGLSMRVDENGKMIVERISEKK